MGTYSECVMRKLILLWKHGNLKTVERWKGIDKQRESSVTNFIFFVTITKKKFTILLLLHYCYKDIGCFIECYGKCVARCQSYYHEETTAPIFSFPTKQDNFKSKRIRIAKDSQRSLTLFVVYQPLWRDVF